MPSMSIALDGTGITIDGQLIQAQVGVLSANNAIIIDSSSTNDTSGSQDTFTGFDNTKLSIPLSFYVDTKYQELSKLNTAYKKLVNNASSSTLSTSPLQKPLTCKLQL